MGGEATRKSARSPEGTRGDARGVRGRWETVQTSLLCAMIVMHAHMGTVSACGVRAGNRLAGRSERRSAATATVAHTPPSHACARTKRLPLHRR